MRLLILEDDPVLSGAYAAHFDPHPEYQVCISATGERALDLHQHERFDFAIVDYDLAGTLNGLETISQLQTKWALPFVMCTGNTSQEVFEQAASLQATAFFTKPVDLNQLFNQIELYRLKQQNRHIHFNIRNLHAFEKIFATANVGICLTDLHGRFVLANPAYCRTYGYSLEELIGQDFTIVLPDELKEPLRTMHYQFLMGTSEESGGRWTVRCKDGSLKPIFVTAARVVLPTGERYKATTVTDISQTVAFEQQLKDLIADKDLLLRELQHRVKNNFQNLTSLVHLQAQSLKLSNNSEAIKGFVMQLEARLTAMARTHELLSRYSMGGRINACELIRETIHQILDSNVSEPQQVIDLHIDCFPIEITDSQGVSLCLILNEALTNSIKYALPHRVPLRIAVKLESAQSGSVIELEIQDNGPGYPPEYITMQRTTSLGMSIMRNLAAKLKGSITFWGQPDGAGLRLTFPVLERSGAGAQSPSS